jgi:hypothetical protein
MDWVCDAEQTRNWKHFEHQRIHGEKPHAADFSKEAQCFNRAQVSKSGLLCTLQNQ